MSRTSQMRSADRRNRPPGLRALGGPRPPGRRRQRRLGRRRRRAHVPPQRLGNGGLRHWWERMRRSIVGRDS